MQGHTVSVSLLSDSEDEHRPDEATSSPSVHVHLEVQQNEQLVSEQQLRSQLLEQQLLCEALQSRSVGWSWQAASCITSSGTFSRLIQACGIAEVCGIAGTCILAQASGRGGGQVTRQAWYLMLAKLCRAANLEAELGTKEAQRAALLAEVALLRSQAGKAEQRVAVLEGEVVALTAQAEQSSYEHELAQKVQHLFRD